MLAEVVTAEKWCSTWEYTLRLHILRLRAVADALSQYLDRGEWSSVDKHQLEQLDGFTIGCAVQHMSDARKELGELYDRHAPAADCPLSA